MTTMRSERVLLRGASGQKFETHVMVSPPNDAAHPTRLGLSCQMQRKVSGRSYRQTCASLGYIDERAPLENRGEFLDPSSLVGRSTKKTAPV
jgi:hypothetical protein